MNDAALSVDNPWPGLAAYTEDQRHLFFGREPEINEVVRLVQRETLTVLFGRSGLGKSSLLRAGVMPRLREKGFFPVTLRLDFAERAEVSPGEQFKALTVATARQAGVAVEGLPGNAAGLTLWEWFHTVEFWGPRNDPVTPILALDQFEEVFTLGRNLPRTEAFIEQLADLVENRVPQAVRQRAEIGGERLACDAARQDYKVVLSLREDFVPKLDSLRPMLPAIMRNRFALAPLNAGSACAVVLGAGQAWVTGDDAREIVAAVAGGDTAPANRPDQEVEPAYLSVMCHELFRRMQTLGRNSITRDLIASERGGILEGLYARSFEGIDDRVRFFVEDRLLTPSGFRGTLPLADATQEGIAARDLHTLVDRRLLRFEDRLGTIHLELSHDLLTGIVLKRRESRRAEAALKLETERARKLRVAQLAQRRRSRVVTGVAVALAVLLIGTLWGGYYCFLQEHEALFRNIVERRGFPVGIGELSAAQARRLPLHYVLVYKGLTRDGWRPRWNAPFRMLAMDQRGNLTANHGVGTFFWRAHNEWQPAELNRDRGTTLGLSAVCQWEYVADAQGDIAYSRGLDRNGRMVYACVYSPTAADSASARIAHFVGPDGFPQLQNKSAAEYVEIHYDPNGWEERILYLDALARPATGPDGAFGIAREHDRQGHLTSAISLDEHGRPMIDRAGNAGLQLSYDKDGFVSEITSVGTDGKICAVTDGWARVRDSYDALGRLILIRSFDANDHPVVRRANLSGIENHYNEDGDLVLETFLGPDGEPRPISCEAVSVAHERDGRGAEVRTTFLDRMGKPTRARDGSCGYTSTFDAQQNLVARTVFGADGKPFLLAEGYAGWKSEFDEQGREIRTTRQGVSGEPVVDKEGCRGWEIRYDARGNPVRYTYLGADGKPAFVSGQVAGWEAEFDPRGREIRRSYFGPAGEPVLNPEGCHGYETTYDERGYPAETTYVGLGGKPVMLAKGYASMKLEHDTQGHETKRTYFDATGKPAGFAEGSHGTLSRYDERGNLVEVTNIGSGGKPAVLAGGLHTTERQKYDLRGDLVEQRFLDADGQPAPNADGVFVVRRQYNGQGWLIEERYFDQADRPMRNKSGVHSWSDRYDPAGNQTRHATFGLHDEPVPGVSHACAETVRFDERNNAVEATFLGPDGKPAVNDDGFAILRTRFDAENNSTEKAHFGPDGQPCLASDHTHLVRKKYDGHRQAVRWDYLGTHDEPVVGIGGYASIDVEYDARGNETRKTFLGADGKPILLAAGYASFQRSYHPAGQLARMEYLGASGEHALCDNGFHSYRAEYDKDGQLLTRTWTGVPGLTAYQTEHETNIGGLYRAEQYLDADGRLVNNAIGYAQAKVERDDTGAVVRSIFSDAQDKPACGALGFARKELVSRVWKYYDTAGREIAAEEHSGVRPLMYVVFLRSSDCVAAKSGLLPGDVIWQMGDFSYPQAVGASWEKEQDYATFKKDVYAAWKTALASVQATPVRVTVIRAGQLVELTLATVPASGIGVSTNLRLVPVQDYDALVRRLGPPATANP